MMLFRISYLERETSDWVWSETKFHQGSQEPLLATVDRRKLAWFRQVTRHDSLSKPSFRTPWRVGDAVVGRENAGQIT